MEVFLDEFNDAFCDPRDVLQAHAASPEVLLLNLCSFGREAVMATGSVPKACTMQWPRGNEHVKVALAGVWVRLASALGHPILELLARENGAPGGHFRPEFASLQRADVVVVVVDDQAHRFQRYCRAPACLRDDLLSAGRVPEEIPVVFQIDHSLLQGAPVLPPGDLVAALAWPRCDHVEGFPAERHGGNAALDRAIDLFEEMEAGRPGAVNDPE